MAFGGAERLRSQAQLRFKAPNRGRVAKHSVEKACRCLFDPFLLSDSRSGALKISKPSRSRRAKPTFEETKMWSRPIIQFTWMKRSRKANEGRRHHQDPHDRHHHSGR